MLFSLFVNFFTVNFFSIHSYERPVKWMSKYHSRELDEDVIKEISGHKLQSIVRVTEQLKKW